MTRFFSSVLVFLLLGVAWLPGATLAIDQVQLGQGVVNSPGQLKTTVINLINAGLGFAALLAAIFVIIGGVRYIISGGDQQGQSAAKNTILYALIGLVVIGVSAAIVNFVLEAIGS